MKLSVSSKFVRRKRLIKTSCLKILRQYFRPSFTAQLTKYKAGNHRLLGGKDCFAIPLIC